MKRTINLMPPVRVLTKQLVLTFIVAVLVAMLALILSYLYIDRMKQDNALLKVKSDEVQLMQQKIAAMNADNELKKSVIGSLNNVVVGIPLSKIYTYLNSAENASIKILSINTIEQQVPVVEGETPEKPVPSVLLLRGYAPSVEETSKFIERIGMQDFISNVSISGVQQANIDVGQVSIFEINISIKLGGI